jgi:hypothetical protein
MISEKRVELNTTAELLARLRSVTGITHTAIGPSQRQEAALGYDVSFYGSGTAAALIQYKRAYVTGTLWTWKLNRTTSRDQHAHLQTLELLGYPVFYAFPRFATLSQLVALRRRLLINTAWFPPSYIQPPGGSSGYHDVTYDVSTGAWQVSSPGQVDLRPPLTIADVFHVMENLPGRHTSIQEFATILNPVMSVPEQQVSRVGDEREAESDFSGQSLLLRYQP